MAKIKAIHAREIIDSRGHPTIETTIWTDNHHGAVASIPSGASTGKFEAHELRDGDPNRFSGQGVLKAVANVNQVISKFIIGKDPTKQGEIDQILLNIDKTGDKSKLGANAILSVSEAVCELGAAVSNMQTYEYLSAKYGLHKPHYSNMPTPFFNMINGGRHGAGNLDFQEFHVIPSSRKPFNASLEMGVEIYQTLKQILIQKDAIHSVGDEGGYAPNLYSNKDALELLVETFESTRYKFTVDVFIGLDLAASNFYKNGHYLIRDKKDPFTADEFISYLIDLKNKYHLFSIEDPLEEESWDSWAELTYQIGQETLIIGDDLIATKMDRLVKAITNHACNSIIVKPNQIGTISEAVSVVKHAKKNNVAVVVSHRSGDTDENFIADFAVGLGAEFVKFGAPSRGERISKYNRLQFIYEYLLAKDGGIPVPLETPPDTAVLG